VSASGVIVTSPDGITWTEFSLNSTSLQDIIWTGTQFVVVGSSGSDRIVTSSDGITFITQINNPGINRLGSVATLFGVAASPTRIIAVGSSATILQSV
jgi:hypothetical protein